MIRLDVVDGRKFQKVVLFRLKEEQKPSFD